MVFAFMVVSCKSSNPTTAMATMIATVAPTMNIIKSLKVASVAVCVWVGSGVAGRV